MAAMQNNELPANTAREIGHIAIGAIPAYGIDAVLSTLQYAVRKCEINRKGWDYLPVLFENELEDYQMRQRINEIGRMNYECILQDSRATA